MNLTDHSERASELVYEALTGECWHKWSRKILKDVFDVCPCDKCGKEHTAYHPVSNPDLANSLDAWRPLWKRMDSQQWDIYQEELDEVMFKGIAKGTWKRYHEPIHHLEAALRTLEVECPTCFGEQERPCVECENAPSKGGDSEGCSFALCECTCNAGKIILYEKLEREVKG